MLISVFKKFDFNLIGLDSGIVNLQLLPEFMALAKDNQPIENKNIKLQKYVNLCLPFLI